jgi:ribosomal protein S18 acetylase RimI-like enzyme
VIRPRTAADLHRCVRLAAAVQAHDGYPVYLPTDLATFVATPGALAAWVAEHDGVVVGQVALNPTSADEVMHQVVLSTGRPAGSFAVVSRLIVSPDTRHEGVGERLLETAAEHAVDLGLQPMLDVTTHSAGAIALYERSGWTRVGEVRVTFPGGHFIDEYVYILRTT